MSLASRGLDALKRFDGLVGRVAVAGLSGRRRELPDDPADVLVIRLWGLGNLTLLAPLLAAHGDRRLRLLTLNRNRGFIEQHVAGLQVLSLPHPLRPGFLLAVLRLIATLRRDPPAVVVDAEQFLLLPAWLVRCASHAPVVGLDTPGLGRGPLLDGAIPYDPTRHVASTYAALFAGAGLRRPPKRGTWGSTASGMRDVRRRLQRLGVSLEAGPLVLLHPGSGDHFPGRRWPPERFARLAIRLARRGATVVVSGSPSERSLVEQVVAMSSGAAVSIAGLVDGAGLGNLLGLADLVVTNDTGPLHLADALGRPVVGLFGPNTPHRYGPRGANGRSLFADLPCSPCLDDRSAKRSSCRDHICMAALDVDSVTLACVGLLGPPIAKAEDLAVAVER